MTKGTRGPEGPATDERDQGTGDDEGTRGPATDEGISLLIGTRGDQRDRRWLR